MVKKPALIILIVFSFAFNSHAWVYPEHRDITLLAIQKLDSSERVVLVQLWKLARKGYENRLDVLVADATQNEHPKYLDYAAFPAIAGDHSTSAEDMLHTILNTDWILDVADVAARLKNGIAASKNRSEREGELRDSDLRLLRVDPLYVSRAGSNNVHFMLARPDVNTSANDYFATCYKEGSEVNLIGTYTWYHTSAILKARRLATESLSPEQQSTLALAMLADEAFALHFLEDGFSAGHVAGIWGIAAVRKGTHDYYDEHGLEVITWNGKRMVLTGDAYLRSSDAETAANTVLMSLVQVLEATRSSKRLMIYNDQAKVFVPDTFNIAKANITPPRKIDTAFKIIYEDILITTPVPGLATGLGEIPRFRSQLGPFIGIAPAGNFSLVSGGFGESQTRSGVIPGLEFAVHMGLGLDGVLNESGDGLVFLDLGWRQDGASSIKIESDPGYNQFGSILSAIPSREALYARIRMPFYVIPGDLLVAGPFLYFFAPKSFNKMVSTAAQGGLIPWQAGIITSAGKFQFILGREIGVYLYGTLQGADAFLVPDDRLGSDPWALVSVRSTKLDFPFFEYRPIRTFSRKQSASLVIQLHTAVDIPGKVTMVTHPEVEATKLKSVWMIGLKLGFDWRYYYSGGKK
jgi:hypothetical protein